MRITPLLPAALLLAVSVGAQDRSFVHISDTHVGAAAGLPHLRLVLREIERLANLPGLVVVTGDLTEKGTPEECVRFREAITQWHERTGIDVLVAPGNHDVRWSADPRARACDDGAPYPRLVRLGDLGFLALDSTLSFGQHGHLSRRQLARAEAMMRAEEGVRDWVLALHHPPAEGKFLDDESGLADLCARLPVSLVLTGHGHAHKSWRERGVPHVMAIGVMNPRFGYRRFVVAGDEITGGAVTITGERDAKAEQDVLAPRRSAATDEQRDRAAAGSAVRKVPLAPGASHARFDVTFLSSALGLGELCILAAEEGEVLALDSDDLRGRWRAQVEEPLWTPPFAAGGHVVVADGSPALRIFTSDGAEAGRVALPAIATAIGAEEESGHRLLALGDGTICRWKLGGDVHVLAKLPAMTRSAPLRIGDRIVVPCWDRHVHVLGVDGAPLGKRLVHASFYYSAATAAPLAMAGRALLFGHDQRLLAFDPLAVDFAGETKFDGVQPAYSGGRSLGSNRVLLGSMDGALAVVDVARGTLEQRIAIPGTVFDSTPLVDVERRRAWVGTMNGLLVGVDLEAGRVAQRHEVGGYVVADPALCGHRVVAASTTGAVVSVPR